MKQVVKILRKNEAEKRIPVLRLEIDYELLTLYDAIVANDEEQIKKSKIILEQFRQELLRLET
ncbi:hypothetical protein [Calidifontibacillus oryziterrae]|uniref:hypothetical protein n=1 Tax=Calidifontibacillus oryziterrae TaxID=1191699 RepID=UPI0002F235DE|nr:hypothetical protein [Calidifontibacillus oryziterrae]